MADQLSSESALQNADISQAQYEAWKDSYKKRDQDVSDALAARKDLRQTIRTAGGKEYLAAFDDVRKEVNWSGAFRTTKANIKGQMLEWERKPIGYQPGFDLSTAPPPSQMHFEEEELVAIERTGYDVGLKGGRGDRNPWNPQTTPFDRWLKGWTDGQDAKVAAEIKTSDTPRRGPGRPRKGATPPAAAATPRRRRAKNGAGAAAAPAETPAAGDRPVLQ